MHKTAMMEQFSRAYIGAIAAQAGCNIGTWTVDDDSIDMSLAKKDIPDCKSSRAQIDIQLKCTYSLNCEGDFFSFQLPVKNYNDLRVQTVNPRLLVVVNIPEDYESWTNQTEEHLCLYHCAYWHSLVGKPDTDNTTTVSVRISTKNIFSAEFLNNAMIKCARERRL